MLDRAQKFLRANKYCFHSDIRKYFPSIEHDVLKRLLRRHILDARVLGVMDLIIDSTCTENGNRKAENGGLMTYPDFGLPSSVFCFQSKGLPIGNLTSQFFANLYLQELDHFVKQNLKCRYYIRYMDDFLILENDKSELKKIKEAIKDFLKV